MIDANIIKSRTQDVFRHVFDDSVLVISEQTVAADIVAWDSMNHINLILALEEQFNIIFTSQEAMSVASVGELFILIDTKLLTQN